MIRRDLHYFINETKVSFSCVGATIVGEPEVVLSHDDDLTANASWSEVGYAVEPFVTPHLMAALRNVISDLVRTEVKRLTCQPLPVFRLEKYHEYVSEEQHREVVRALVKVGLPKTRLPFSIDVFSERVSQICNADVVVREQIESPWGIRISSIRIARPMSNDANPPHRDTWSPTGRNLLNIYVPICGSNAHSSLSLIPRSHRWLESDTERTIPGTTRVNGIAFSVGCVVSSKFGLNMIRPDPKEDEFLAFTPYLIHGGAQNFNRDVTRVSLEMRFQRKGSRNSTYVVNPRY